MLDEGKTELTLCIESTKQFNYHEKTYTYCLCIDDGTGFASQ